MPLAEHAQPAAPAQVTRQAQPEQLPTCWEHSIRARLLGSGRRWAAVEAAPGAVRLRLRAPGSPASRSAGCDND